MRSRQTTNFFAYSRMETFFTASGNSAFELEILLNQSMCVHQICETTGAQGNNVEL